MTDKTSAPLTGAEPPLIAAGEARTWVLFEDERLLVLNKPGWVVCHPSKNGPWSSLAGAARLEFQLDAVRLVYRLDRETSGVILLAKTQAMGGRLQKAMGRRAVGKLYVAVLEGEMRGPRFVEEPLGPDPSANVTVKQCVTTVNAQEAVTRFTPLAARGGYTLAAVEPLTGRKHQIRAHAEWSGHRVVGDKLYGPDPGLYLEYAEQGWTARHAALLPLPRQALHCAQIDLRPAGMEQVFRAPWPADLAKFCTEHMQLDTFAVERLITAAIAEMSPVPSAPAGPGR
ncbi:MAG: RluA family pseudouridine synthase [Opitutaceae bacterium]|nr:RluA family pseudouridine synthase [Opitutaceae bacterium]